MFRLFVYLASGMEMKNLNDRVESAEFYENRYIHGYMGFWSSFEKERLLALIRELKLPPEGKALDFGCGRGIFTRVFLEALPGWKIFGCDISAEAVSFAGKHSPEITFFILGDKSYAGERFDFIHSHHVLEHTFDEKVTASEMCAYAAQKCVMLHSFPCNHEGSLEYKLSFARRNGIDSATGKFFFEDSAHMRRMKVSYAASLFEKHGFEIWKDYYANQYFGALKWIAESDFGLVLRISNPFYAKDFSSFLFLFATLAKLKIHWLCFFAASAFEPADRGRFYWIKKFLQVISFIPFFWFAIPVRSYLNRKAKEEWMNKRTEKNGSDLFLILKRP